MAPPTIGQNLRTADPTQWTAFGRTSIAEDKRDLRTLVIMTFTVLARHKASCGLMTKVAIKRVRKITSSPNDRALLF